MQECSNPVGMVSGRYEAASIGPEQHHPHMENEGIPSTSDAIAPTYSFPLTATEHQHVGVCAEAGAQSSLLDCSPCFVVGI